MNLQEVVALDSQNYVSLKPNVKVKCSLKKTIHISKIL